MSTNPAESEHWSEIAEILDVEVNRLPDKLRVPFVLFHLENRSLAEVAVIVESSIPTIGTWLQRAREQLAARLRRRGITVGAAAITALLSNQVVAGTISATLVAATVQAAASFSSAGVEANAACSPLVNALLKASAVGSTSKKVWYLSGLIVATLIGLPLAVLWLFPMIQTRLSPDFPLLQGESREIANEQNGGPMNAKPSVAYVGSLVISGRHFHRFQTLASGQVLGGDQGAFVLDDTHSPKVIDFRLWQGTIHGVYAIDGENLTLCVSRNGAHRPDDLSTAPNDDRTMTRYERVR